MKRSQSSTASCASGLHKLATPAVLALALVVAGCDSGRLIKEADTRPVDVNKLHPVSAEVQVASLEVSPARGGTLGSEAFLDITKFVREYRRDGRSMLDIEVPRGSAASRSVDSVRYIAETNGVPPRRIRVVHRKDGVNSIRLKYESVAAIAPECGDWPEDILARPEIGPYTNFGCATQRNLANMVAHPTDLMFPQVEAPRQSDNRPKPYQDFSKGTGGPGNTLPTTAR